MTLNFPTDKSFYKADNLFKHDFLLRKSFDTVDLLWFRTHEPVDIFTGQGLDETDLSKIENTVENCPDNELESTFQDVLNGLAGLQAENEIYDFYYEFYYPDIAEMVKDEHMIQRMNDIVNQLRIIENDELSSDYDKFWEYVREKAALRAIISPEVFTSNSLSNAQAFKKNLATKSKGLSETSDVNVIIKGKEGAKQAKQDELSLMNARFLLQQLKDKGLEEDRLTYVNIFAEENDEEGDEADYSSSGTLSTDLELSSSVEISGSRLTEISFERHSPEEGDSGMKDAFKDQSFDSLFYVVRHILEDLKASSDSYFSEAPIILLENDLVLEKKEREFKDLTNYNKIMNQCLVKVTDINGIEGINSRLFRHGILMITNELVSQMEKVKQEGVKTSKDTKRYSEFTFEILRSPKVELSDYRKLISFEEKSEELKAIGQKRRIKHYKTMVCLAGRTKLRRYDFSEKITTELNQIGIPMQKIANVTKTARQHATLTVDGYLETLVKLLKKRMFYEDYPDDLYTKIHELVEETRSVQNDVEEMKQICAEAKKKLEQKAIYKPLGKVRRIDQRIESLDINTIKKVISETGSSERPYLPETKCFTSGLNLVINDDYKPRRTIMPSKLNKTNQVDDSSNYFESHGFPRLSMSPPSMHSSDF